MNSIVDPPPTVTGPCEVQHRHNDTCRLMHVHILDHSGNLLADVDARSTSDALAYYLDSRRIDPGATEARVRMAASPDPCNPIGDRVPIVRTTREFSAVSASGWVERDITAKVFYDPTEPQQSGDDESTATR